MIIHGKSTPANSLRRVLLMVAVFIVASAIGYGFRYTQFPDTNIAIIYLLAVLMTVWLIGSFVFGFMASILATFLFNYFFTEPIYAFAVDNPHYIATFITMTITALIASSLTANVQRSAAESKEKELEIKAIYNLTNRLTDAADIHDIAGIAAFAISESFQCSAACLCFDEDGNPENSFIQHILGGNQIRREIEDREETRHRIEGIRTGSEAGIEFTDWPIYGRESILGVIRMPNSRANNMNDAQMRLLRSMIENTALSMDRFRSAELRIKSREEIVMERYRGNLLRSISHDIRTPLSGIVGTSEMLMDMTSKDDPRFELVSDIEECASWLHSIVENILNLTRMQDSKLPLIKHQEAVEEIIGAAVARISTRVPKYEITVNIPSELLLAPMDAKLIEQVIINLLDNAVRHSKPENEIVIEAKLNENRDMVIFAIKDRGTGIHAKDLPNIFDAFYTSQYLKQHAKHGAGLGLAICETIVKAHGGSIEAQNRTDGCGAEFTFTLPLEDRIDE